MPPHTISPTPTSQGLGISLSTLSPPTTQNGRQHGHRQPVTFTGMGVMPRSGSQPQMLPTQGEHTRFSGNSRALPSTNTRGAPLYQPGFALKPTHTRGGSKGFNTFSALPPSQSSAKPPTAPKHPQPQTPSSVRGFLPKLDMSPDSSVESSAFGDDDDDEPLRQPSGSRQPSGRRARRNKSVDFLRSLSSRNGAESTLGGAAYVPLSGSDEPVDSGRQEHLDVSQEGDHADNRHSTASSTGATGAVTHNGASICGPAPSDAHHTSFYPTAHPLPAYDQRHLVPEVSRDASSSSTVNAGLSRGMSRSRSTPDGIHGSLGPTTKRFSDPSTGTHSKNRVLRDAENGAMMLAFSPGRDYRPGQQICGPGSDLFQTPVAPIAPRAQSAEEVHEESLRSRPWSNSTMSNHMRPQTLGSRGRSLSEGAGLLARQGTLFHPDASKQRSSAELSLMLGQPRSRRLSGNRVLPPPDVGALSGSTDEVRLEAAKRKKARVEVDVVLERECVVEGGDLRGRLEIIVNGGKRGEGLRIAGGKARVVGFEDISAESRHIFYHHPHCLPVFDPKGDPSLPIPSLFASGPDEEGYRLAAEGTHSIPFRMRLPLGGGAKGAFTSPNNKGPCVRYVVVGSVKLFIPSTGKRSIAHFYRPIVILPYLNPSLVLAPTPEPIENTVERGLGWSLGGEKGKVEMRISLGRRNWVAGQRAWCEVGIKNNSSRKIKTITLALLQTVQTFHPDAELNTGNLASRLRRRSAGPILPNDDPGTPETDACQTSTVRRKLTEEIMEADSTTHGEGRVTGKSWWTGVEPGDKDHWDMSLLIPNGLITIRRTRLIEVTYLLRVTVNGSIYVDVPINLINFLSIDPPPMPGDALRTPIPRSMTTQVPVGNPHQRPQPTRMPSDNSLNSAVNPARASSTTLHVDALLQAGRARADAESNARKQGTETAQADRKRPLSVGSEYTLPHAKSLADLLSLDPPPLPEMGSEPASRPPAHTMKSFLSERSDHTLDQSYEQDAEGDRDQSMTEARRKVGRQKSLVLAISRAEQRALEAMDELEMADHSNEGYHAMSPGKDSVQLGEFVPDGTPFEHAVYELGEMPPVPDLPRDREGGQGQLRIRNPSPEPDEIAGDESMDVGDQTVLLDLVKEHLPQIRASSPLNLDDSPARDRKTSNGGYDYAPESSDFNPASPLVGQQDDSLRARYADLDPYAGLGSEQYAIVSRERYGSYSPSEQESEVGQVVDAVKRNLSVRLPARLVPAGSTNDHSSQDHDLHDKQSASPQDAAGYRLTTDRPGSLTASSRVSASPLHPSPLRQVQQLPLESEGGGVRKVSRPLPKFPYQAAQSDQIQQPADLSPRSVAQPNVPNHTAVTTGSVQQRSQLRHQISMDSRYGSTEDEAPGLAPSVASDSASSEGHLESPPNSAGPIATSILPDTLPESQVTHYTSGQSWIPGAHDVDHDVFGHKQATTSQITLGPNVQAQDALSSDSHSMPGSPQTVESMLPSVRTKIDQLNNRDEALRKFSVSGAISPSTPRASVISNPRGSILIQARQSIISPSMPIVTSPVSTTGRYTPQAQSPKSPTSIPEHMQNTTPTKRRSYTAALGPRHTRVASDDSTETTTGMARSPSTHRVGNTTYLTKRSFAQSRHISPPKGLSAASSIYTQSSGLGSPPRSYGSSYRIQNQQSPTKLERNMSVSSTSTSATTIEAALMRRPGGPRQPLSPAKGDGRTMGPRQLARPVVQYGRVSEEEDSDGLV